jgi:hypothetical protein
MSWWRSKGTRGSAAYAPYDVNHVLCTGQSLSVGANSTAVSLTQPYGNLMLAGGVMATGSFSSPMLPLVESSVETMSSAMANLVSELCLPDLTHNMLVSVHGAGGTPYSGLKKGQAPYTQGMAQLASGRDRTAALSKSYTVRLVTSVHGESDAIAVNTAYADNIIEWQEDYEADVRAATGQTTPVPMLHSQNSSQAGAITPLAMLDAHIRCPGKSVLVCPKYHLTYSDGLHLDTNGYRHLGEEYAKAYKRIVIDGGVWEPVRPKTVTRNGAVITIVFHVPRPPLVFDTTLVAAANNMGFGYVNHAATAPAAVPGGSAPAISSVEIIAEDTVRITLASPPSAPGRIRYAIDYVLPAGPRGNLRDSDNTQSRFGWPLYNWGVQFEHYIV